jgi:hypothetical protein
MSHTFIKENRSITFFSVVTNVLDLCDIESPDISVTFEQLQAKSLHLNARVFVMFNLRSLFIALSILKDRDEYLQIIKMKAVCVLQGEAVSGTVYFEQVFFNLFLVRRTYIQLA